MIVDATFPVSSSPFSLFFPITENSFCCYPCVRFSYSSSFEALTMSLPFAGFAHFTNSDNPPHPWDTEHQKDHNSLEDP